jgi:hypothetical protein
MIKKLLLSVLLTVGVVSGVSLISGRDVQAAAPECKADADCKTGEFCILALKPHQCKPPQAAGAPCKRDAVCASSKCEIASGKEAGVCK